MSLVLSISNQKGGSGKSVATYNTGLSLVQNYNLDVLILDLDPQGTIGDITALHQQQSNGNGGRKMFDVMRCSFNNVSSVIDKAKSRYHVIMLDMPGILHTPDGKDKAISGTLELLDICLVPIVPSVPDALSSLQFYNKALKIKAKNPSMILKCFINKHERINETAEVLDFISANNMDMMKRDIPKNVVFPRALNTNESVLNIPKSNLAQNRFRLFMNELAEYIN